MRYIASGDEGNLFDNLGLSVDDDVWHFERKQRPHLVRQQVGNNARCDAELEQIFHGAMLARPLVTMLVLTCLQETPASTATSRLFFELYR